MLAWLSGRFVDLLDQSDQYWQSIRTLFFRRSENPAQAESEIFYAFASANSVNDGLGLRPEIIHRKVV